MEETYDMTANPATEVSFHPRSIAETGVKHNKNDPSPNAVGLPNRLVKSPLD
jgi:hypothetical protein